MPPEDVDQTLITEAQALATVIRILGPVTIVYRGSTEEWQIRHRAQTHRAAWRWLRETALAWTTTPKRRWSGPERAEW